MAQARYEPTPEEQHDAIRLIENDHRVVEGLFETYERLGRDGEPGERWRTVRSMVEELRLHAAMEEQVFYPAVQEALGEAADELVEESLREHAEAKQSLDEIEALEPTTEVFHERVTALIEEVRHHVDEEEQEILPKLREAMDSQVLLRLGEELEGAKLTLLGVMVGGGDRDAAEGRPPAGRATKERRPGAKRASRAKSSSTTARTPGGRGAARLVYHVTPTSTGRWAVARKGAARPSATFDRKAEAVARGKELAKRRSRGQLVVHGRDGRIQNEFTYGDDPRRTRG